MLLTKTKLNTIEVVIFRAFIDLYINHGEFVSVNNVLRENSEMKEGIKRKKKNKKQKKDAEYTI